VKFQPEIPMTRLDGLVRRARNRAEEDTNFSLLFESALCNLLDRPDSVSVEALALRKLSEAFDRFVGACLDESGNPRMPSQQDIAKARAYLPPYCKHAYTKKPRS
jgi:hypothetical protein